MSAYGEFGVSRFRRGRNASCVLLLIAVAVFRNTASVRSATELVVNIDRSSSVIKRELSLETQLGRWEFSGETRFEDRAWSRQSFQASWSTSILDVCSRLRLEPAQGRFKDWRIEAGWTRGLNEWEIEHKVTRRRRWLSFDVERKAARLDVDHRLRLRAARLDSPYAFYDAETEASFDLFDADASVALEIDDDGFEAATVECTDLKCARIPWSSFDIEWERTIEASAIELSATAEPMAACCLELEWAMLSTVDLPAALRLEEIVLTACPAPLEIEANLLLDRDAWIQDTYAATVEFRIERRRANRERAIELKLFWPGGNARSILPTRAIGQLAAELPGGSSVELECEVSLDTATLLSIECGLLW